MTNSTHDHIHEEVLALLGGDASGHSIDHVDRVHRLSLELAGKEGANEELVSLIALLHDVDDYKLFGADSAENLTNARAILERHAIEPGIAQQVLDAIPKMGYNNYLEGKRPTTLEGMIVSDADMCDAIGSQGLIRVFEYNTSKGRPFFIKAIPPIDETPSAKAYRASGNEHAAQHFFDKLLRLPSILMTDSGRAEGEQRASIMHQFLDELFREEGAEDWREYLRHFEA